MRTRAVRFVLVLVACALAGLPGFAWGEEGPPAPAASPAPSAAPGAPSAPATPLAERYDEASQAARARDAADLPPPLEELGEVVVTATRVPQLEVVVPRSVNVVTQRRIVERGVANVVDALDDQVGVWVEKRTSHTSDLVIRGLSGGNLLALVDGNTLSTFWGEGGFAGDDMYGKINADNVARIEVVRGPASVLYGSNALGAVVNFITKESPLDYTDGGLRVGGVSYVQGGTSPSGWRLHQEGYGATRNLRFFAGVTYIDFGTTVDGSGEVQTPTAARGWYGDFALNWKISREMLAKFTVQVTDLDPLYRFYRPTQSNENWRLALAGWLEFPQLSCRTGLADSLRLGVYYQDKVDTRRFYDATTKEELRWGEALWKTIQVDLQARKQIACHALTYGVEFESTDGESPDDEQFTMHYPDGRVEKPAPDSLWSSLGGYVQDEWQFHPRWRLSASVRFDMLRLATEVDDEYVAPGGSDPALDEFTDYQPAFAGGLQLAYEVARGSELYGGWTRGFRQFAPHFGITEHAGFGVVVPNQMLTPITADQFELGFKRRSEWVSADAIGYYTLYQNFQNLRPGTFQGQDWYDVDGDGVRDPLEDVYQNVGNGDAFVYGVELATTVNLAALDRRRFGDAWSVGGNFTWNYGQDETNDVPLRHTQPMAAVATLRWEKPEAGLAPWAELQGRFVDRFDRIPPDRLANDVGYYEDPQDATSGKRRTWGLPGYTVLDLRGGFTVCERLEVTVGVGNLLDKLYRPAHARWDAPGRNVYFTVSYTW